jgi:hypothetical protein
MSIEKDIERLTHTGTKYVFTRMQNILWVTNGLALSSIIEKKAVNLLATIITQHHTNKPLVINFSRIIDIDDHALDEFFDALVGNKRQVIIIEGNHLFARITSLKKDKNVNIKESERIIVFGKMDAFSLEELEAEREVLIKNFKKDSIKGCFEKFSKNKRLSSTPLIANGEFNSNKLISDPKSFLWMTTFLSDELESIIDAEKVNSPKLLSVSLRGAPFAAALGMILNIPYETIDHFGPKHKVLDNDFLNRFARGTNYIFIGDFSIGGTEIKIAKTFLELNGCFLKQAIVLGSYIEPEHFSDYFKLHRIVNLKELELVKYEI